MEKNVILMEMRINHLSMQLLTCSSFVHYEFNPMYHLPPGGTLILIEMIWVSSVNPCVDRLMLGKSGYWSI